MTSVIQKYLSYLRYEKNYSSYTEISYSKDLAQFEEFVNLHYEGIKLSDIESDIVRQWIASLMESGISARSVNRKLSSLKSFYRYLTKIGEVKTNPLKRITGPKAKKPLPSFVNDSDMETILDSFAYTPDDSFDSYRDFTILELFYVTGMRRAELINLKVEDIDLSAETIRVNGKRNKQRLIPFSKETKAVITAYLEKRNSLDVNLSDRFFVKKDGNPVYPMLIYRLVHNQLSGIPTLSKASPHVLRHSFATEMLNNGAEINAVKELLGHSSLASTEVYTHTSFEELKKTYKKAHPRA
ncbi:MAG: tyrosine-type recombinase/integrase [Dysgonomonas sp.]